MILNLTMECSCGQTKRPTKQWCDACWIKLPKSVKDAVNKLAVELRAAVGRAEECLKGKPTPAKAK